MDPLVKTRKVLGDVWDRGCLLHGRLWPPKIQDEVSKTMNRVSKGIYHGSNITFFWKDEAITICKGKDEKIKIHPFKRVEENGLSSVIKDILNNEGIETE